MILTGNEVHHNLFCNSLLAEEAIFHKNLKIKKKDTTVNVKGGFKIIREKFGSNIKIIENKIDIEPQISKRVNDLRNEQLNQFSNIYFLKVKKNMTIHEK